MSGYQKLVSPKNIKKEAISQEKRNFRVEQYHKRNKTMYSPIQVEKAQNTITTVICPVYRSILHSFRLDSNYSLKLKKHFIPNTWAKLVSEANSILALHDSLKISACLLLLSTAFLTAVSLPSLKAMLPFEHAHSAIQLTSLFVTLFMPLFIFLQMLYCHHRVEVRMHEFCEQCSRKYPRSHWMFRTTGYGHNCRAYLEIELLSSKGSERDVPVFQYQPPETKIGNTGVDEFGFLSNSAPTNTRV
eukprot:TRINITY_DN646076_c0_g1_i1.p1 TRINITY_DN646076_c0_g1~~TRINITY_DN646076_c0_g1_i1.p1  ORF type:complete len:245 (-),score=18.00 TRINITY_DN646076_c0_g1_i1:309-1043(-)